ncbi:MAG: UDP-N-acetylmuramoyl-tripeptide--D-alanyl-D-alanine ligase [Burkholderiaceae bacterium]
MFDLNQALGWLSGARLIGDGAVVVRRVCADTRAVEPGDLFVAIRGERFDANRFADQAEARGAAAVLVERAAGVAASLRGPVIEVDDSRIALGELAAGWRRRFTLPTIAVAGSNGKTTVKEMIASILARQFGAAHRLATAGNLNNDIGVPMTLFGLRDAHRAAVIELGMNHPGEIAWLTRIAAPTVALVNNAQREHQEFMAGVEATAHENGAVIAGLPADGVAVYPGDDAHAPIWRELAGARRVMSFGLSGPGAPAGPDAPPLAVWAAPDAVPEAFVLNVAGQALPVRLDIAGRHNVRNALAAAACCAAIGIAPATIVAGLQAFAPVKGRLVRTTLANGATLIDDSYNANPDSVRAAIDVLAPAGARATLVLGDMGEVGDQGPAFHREVGAYARERGLGELLALGDATAESVAAFGPGGHHFADVDALLARLRDRIGAGDLVLVKGSRFMKMERVVAALRGDGGSDGNGNGNGNGRQAGGPH